MALHWEWKNKIGEAVLRQQVDAEGKTKDFVLSLYEGNCMLIMLFEDEKTWTMYSFWADNDHMKSCLGLVKGESNLYNTEHAQIVKITFNPKKSHNWKKFLPAIIQAFDNIDIEIREV